MKSIDFYWLLIDKIHTEEQTGAKTCNTTIPLDKNTRKTIFKSVRTSCKETKFREFQVKFLHRKIVTRKELHRFEIKPDKAWSYCGEDNSINHTFLHCGFSNHFPENVIGWFNESNNYNFTPKTTEILFGLSNTMSALNGKFNYT